LVLEDARERRDRARTGDRIRVEKDEDVAACLARAAVAAGAEAVVPRRVYNARALGRSLDLGPAAAVVDDDDVLPVERVEAARERVAAPVRDDDDGSAQYAPRRARTAGSVFARIEMSSQIDQFSR
jgi:hypothetical protein